MIVIAGGVPIQGGLKEEVIRACLDVEGPTRSEPGCISYTYFFGVSDPNYLHVFEQWESEEALQAHLQSPHTVAFLTKVPSFAAGMPVVNKYIISSHGSLF